MPKSPFDSPFGGNGFEDLFESHFGGSSKRKESEPKEPEPEVISDGWCVEQVIVDNWIIFLSLAILESALLKSGYPADLANAIRKRIHEIAPYYGPVKEKKK